MNDLYEVLEICLREIEQGASIETVLFRYPDLADELRPLLEGALYARNMAIVAPSAAVFQRNRAKVLRHAAQLREREARVVSSRRLWGASLRRLVVTLAVLIALFVSGTSLVRAASTTLPGDNLYPVKRTWEDVLVLVTLNSQEREALEVEHENERLHELRELFQEGRSAEVDFAGLVTAQNGDAWIIGGFPVLVSAETEIRDGQMAIGSAVRVEGQTRADGVILAERIRLLPSNAILPDEMEIESESHEGLNQQDQNSESSGPGSESENEGPKIEETQSPEPESEPNGESSNSGSSNENSISDSNENSYDGNRQSEDHSGNSINENEDSNASGGEDHSSEDSSDHSGEDQSDSSGEDNSNSGGE